MLETPRLTLRQLQLSDDNEIFFLRSDPAVNRYIDRPLALTIQDARQFISGIIEQVQRNEILAWVITRKDQPRCIGTVTLWNIVPEEDLAEIGYSLMPACQGQGIMQEALAAVIDYGFHTLMLKKIEAYTHQANQRSQRLLERHHFTRDTAAQRQLLQTETDLLAYSLTQP
ncbi:MAG: GNAT family N-acetyltransferase [Bacteroidetes bacterium]|nr:GNAT family N-acetyltransferase [Bacteroidota bacterium]